MINWSQPAISVSNFIRGLSPYPAAWTEIHGKIFKIFPGAIKEEEPDDHTGVGPGEFVTVNKTYLYFKTADPFYSVSDLQPEGKKRMSIADFFRGNKL